jgi:hypothetical protein
LAALPFRREQSILNASTEPNQVTGPTQSALNGPAADKSTKFAPVVPSLNDLDRFGELPAFTPGTGFAAVSDPPARRHIDIPLTYEDLAVPIDQPKPILDRFSATATVHKQQLDAEKIAGLVMPPLETLPIEQQHALMQSAQQNFANQPGSEPGTSGRLASASSTSSEGSNGEASSTKRYDAKASAELERERYWIRQPK